jgi:hypothetical protein
LNLLNLELKDGALDEPGFFMCEPEIQYREQVHGFILSVCF